MSFAAITGVGMAVPDRVVTNEGLGADAEWVIQRTGIRERRVAAADENTSTLAARAGRAALGDAGLDPGMLDMVVVATCTPDRPIPGVAPHVASDIGARSAGAFDLNAACAGFLTGLHVCSAMIRAGVIARALVVGSEVLSRFVDPADVKTSVLFGDGAGAVVLDARDEPAGLLDATFGSDGEGADLIAIRAGGSRRPASSETVARNEHVIAMNGPEVFRAAVRVMTESAQHVMASSHLSAADVDLLICHQANQRIVSEVGRRLGIADDRLFSNIARYGNTSAASIPIALCEAGQSGRLHEGARAVVTAVGAGLTWTAGVLLWTRVASPAERSRTKELVHG